MSNYLAVGSHHRDVAFFAAKRGRWLNHLMMQSSEVSEAAGTPIAALRVALSQEARASLEAVRVAQDAARQRARQQTRNARLLFATGAAVAVLIGGMAPRVARWRHARAQPPVAALPAAATSEPAPQAAAAPPEPAPAAVAPPAVAKSADPASAEQQRAGAAQGCDLASVRSAAWRVSPEGCAQAFAADSTNASLALAVAQAEHARGHLTEAAQWAKRALALDPKAAEAYVLIARADVNEGRREEAGTAYRHYLDLAPRGWHHAEARRALRSVER